MKKYVKPELFYERFELSQHIASCSSLQFNFDNETDCKLREDNDFGIDPEKAFGDYDSCTTVIEGYCYFNASGDSIVFSS